MTEEKTIYVWGSESCFNSSIIPIYSTKPELIGNIIGTGGPVAVAKNVREIVKQGYKLVLDETPSGEYKPLRECREIFTSLAS